MLAVVAAIAAAIAIGVALYKNWDTIKAKASQVFTAIKTTVTTNFNTLKNTVTTVWNAIKNAITKPIETAKNTVSKAIQKIKSFFPLKIGKLFSGMKLPHFTVKDGNKSDGETLAARYWGRSDISLKDIAAAFAYSAIVVTFAKLIGGFLSDIIPQSNAFLKMLNTFFGSQYVWITNISMVFATVFEKRASQIHGAKEVGTWLIYQFYFGIL